jgi:3-methyladenine DNA glycosylase AlkD
MTAQEVKEELQKSASAEDALFLQGFFKTGEGHYGAGDVFIGVRMGPNRAAAKKFKDLPLAEVQKLLDSKVHEHRMVGLLILTMKYPMAEAVDKQHIYEFYLKNIYKGRVNNWDLIDVTCPRLIGQHLVGKSHDVLYVLAKSEDLWQRRVAIVSTFTFIAKGEPATSIDLAKILLHDEHDLIQKAVGWMLREIGKRCDRAILLKFLDEHSHEMPRTMLRYSIEHLPPDQRSHYMNQ